MDNDCNIFLYCFFGGALALREISADISFCWQKLPFRGARLKVSLFSIFHFPRVFVENGRGKSTFHFPSRGDTLKSVSPLDGKVEQDVDKAQRRQDAPDGGSVVIWPTEDCCFPQRRNTSFRRKTLAAPGPAPRECRRVARVCASGGGQGAQIGARRAKIAPPRPRTAFGKTISRQGRGAFLRHLRASGAIRPGGHLRAVVDGLLRPPDGPNRAQIL